MDTRNKKINYCQPITISELIENKNGWLYSIKNDMIYI